MRKTLHSCEDTCYVCYGKFYQRYPLALADKTFLFSADKTYLTCRQSKPGILWHVRLQRRLNLPWPWLFWWSKEKEDMQWSWINWEGFFSDSLHVVVFLGFLLRSSGQVYKKASQSWRFTETSLGISGDICTGSTRTCQGKKEPGKAQASHPNSHYRFSYMFCNESWENLGFHQDLSFSEDQTLIFCWKLFYKVERS